MKKNKRIEKIRKRIAKKDKAKNYFRRLMRAMKQLIFFFNR